MDRVAGHCAAFVLGKFLTVSIKILKNQGLSLTLGKATSPYGRLLCCLYDEGGFYQ